MFVALLDADPIVYLAGFANEKRVGKKDRIVGPLAHALHATRLMVDTIERDVRAVAKQPVEFEYYLTGHGNFREQLATIRVYKGNRDPLAKPYYFREIRGWLVTQKQARLTVGWEADDAVSMRQYNAEPESTAIVTVDKDLLMVPGLHFNYGPKRGAKIVSYLDGRRAFYAQLLTGDPTDNVGGCYMVGKKTAKNLLYNMTSEEELYETAHTAYANSIEQYGDLTRYAHLGADGALLENARLLWMLEYPGQLWVPPGSPPEYLPGYKKSEEVE